MRQRGADQLKNLVDCGKLDQFERCLGEKFVGLIFSAQRFFSTHPRRDIARNTQDALRYGVYVHLVPLFPAVLKDEFIYRSVWLAGVHHALKGLKEQRLLNVWEQVGELAT